MATIGFWALVENAAAKNTEKAVRNNFQEFNGVLRKAISVILKFCAWS